MLFTGVRTWIYGNGRHLSTSKRIKGLKIVSTNSELKQLYGPVIERESIGETQLFEPFDASDWEHTRKESQSAMETEKYWLLRNYKKDRVKVLQRGSQTTSTVPPTPVTDADASPKSEQPKSRVSSTKELLKQFLSSQPNHAPTIPFDASGLDSIPRYPLVCQKATTDQIDAALKAKLPSISKILTATMSEGSRYILKKWKLDKIAELGEDGFREYEQKTLRTGQQFHSSIQTYFEQQQLPDENSPVYTLWQSVGGVLVELDPKPILIEKSIVHPDLKYRGIIDSVAVINNTMCAIEWKTSEKLKPRLTSTYDAPIQLCAYLGALNIDPRYDISARNGYVVVAYKDGTKANAFYLYEKEVKKYWAAWLKRVQEFWIRTRDGTLPDPI